jgi:acetyl-CoA carboxylase biotin carboxyl carrier protein
MKDKIDYEEISRLVNFLEEKKLINFELEVEGRKIKISREEGSAPVPAAEKTSVQTANPLHETEKSPFPAEAHPQEAGDSLHYVTSPMVGTFYRAPDPTSSPFVDVGDEVKKSQTLCIVEAMKLMNEIESEVEGVIKEIYVENGKPVEYGQKLFAIQTIS